ncbi:squalene/phytoene synthase family protein [Amphibacillus sp. Q70]|uniref:squalene/phytoene synthase family protein n=1 Tax=Amphibacillus sp. Q70 TaxID=3453416 RepID=UPI003F837C1E
MSEPKKVYNEAMRVLKQTSRTFYIPIVLLKPTLKKTVASAYLCMRAIDEIEDHEDLSPDIKTTLLQNISQLLHNTFDPDAYHQLIQPYMDKLPEVTIRLSEWLTVCPKGIIEKVKKSTGIMASGMAKWVEKDWQISTEEELDEYTYYVAGLVGVMLSDIWKWYDDTETDHELAIGFGRGLQSVNILRNQDEDQERGVNFIPNGWSRSDLFQYATKNLNLAEQYIETINNRNIATFCKIPYKLAVKTLAVMKDGREKMTREEVKTIVDQVTD